LLEVDTVRSAVRVTADSMSIDLGGIAKGYVLSAAHFGVTEWTLTGTSVSGKSLEVRGVDLLEFVGAKITARIPSGRS